MNVVTIYTARGFQFTAEVNDREIDRWMNMRAIDYSSDAGRIVIPFSAIDHLEAKSSPA